jgi:hypothetical protein
MNACEKIQFARKEIEQKLHPWINDVLTDLEDPRLMIGLDNGSKIYIQYNNFDQYSYSLIFSGNQFDRIRYDNYDVRWDVQSSPHHMHPYLLKNAEESPMNGDPEHDITLLCENLLNFTLKEISDELDRILSKWNVESLEQFVKDVQEGNILEGENDAIDLINLRDQTEKISGIKRSLKM